MNDDIAVSALAALAHADRLSAFRMLVRAGPNGVASGEIAEALSIPPTRMSFHLATLERSGLLRSWRDGRRILYAASYDEMRRLLAFLAEDCCSGNPQICGDLATLPFAAVSYPPIVREAAMTVTIYHNPDCGTSCNTLEMIRQSGEDPKIVEYLKTPPSREVLAELLDAMSMKPRDLLREKGTPYAELGLDDPALSDEELLQAMVEHPILIDRPIVVTEKGVKLCRPSETVLPLLDRPVRTFTKEDGESVTASGPAA